MARKESFFIWENGAFVASEPHQGGASLSCDGLAVFEDVRCYRGAKTKALYAFRLAEHMDRLMRSARFAMMDAPCTAKRLSAAVAALLKTNDFGACFIRVAAFRWRSLGPMAGRLVGDPLARIVLTCWHEDGRDDVDGDDRAEPAHAPIVLKAVVSSWRSISVDSLPSMMRCSASSSVSALARQEALSFGADEAVLLNAQGFVCQSSCGNVFVVRDGVLSTPPASAGAYDSIMRDTALNLAMDMDVPAIEEQLTRADLLAAEEVFIADDLNGFVPVVRIDGRQVGKGKPGVITEALRKRFAKTSSGELDGHSGWIEQVG